MKFLEKLDFFKPLGKGLAEADTFMRREMPFNMSWGFPAALAATYFGAPYALQALQGAGGAAGGASGGGSITGSSMLSNYGLDAGKGFVASNGANFSLPSSAYTPEYLNLLAKNQGVDLGDPTLFQRFTGNTEQGLYNPKQMSPNKILADLLKNQGKSKQQVSQQPTQQISSQQGQATYEDLNEPFYNQNMTQQERSRRLLAQQLRLLSSRTKKPQFNNAGVESLLSNLNILG